MLRVSVLLCALFLASCAAKNATLERADHAPSIPLSPFSDAVTNLVEEKVMTSGCDVVEDVGMMAGWVSISAAEGYDLTPARVFFITCTGEDGWLWVVYE